MPAKDEAFGTSLIDATPRLRRQARRLAGNACDAEDLVQEALLKAWLHRARFQAGTNLNAWLCCILRNHFFSERRKAGREVCGPAPEGLTPDDLQTWVLTLQEVRAFVDQLGPEHRFALLALGSAGLTHEEAAELRPAPAGTSKSRLFRARERLKARFDPQLVFGA